MKRLKKRYTGKQAMVLIAIVFTPLICSLWASGYGFSLSNLSRKQALFAAVFSLVYGAVAYWVANKAGIGTSNKSVDSHKTV